MARPRKGWESLGALRARLAERSAALSSERREAVEPSTKPLADTERDLFQLAMTGVEPLKRPPRHIADPAPPSPVARQRALDDERVLAESLSDELDPLSLLETDERLSWRRVGIGPEVVRKLRRGEWIIQDEVDLHGARRDEARLLVAEFLREAMRRGLRCVRIVHGKGLGSVARQPVLKSKVRVWLTQKDEVLAFCQARPEDGGSGALIVLLRPAG